ncbi:MAG TPA: GntR family transcriptional regulator [Galbitalea sp.]|jgi:DNA-binding GntR family transcriptional regulator|nr:GntR family transcriptional regulator [Galbitalea sp.]
MTSPVFLGQPKASLIRQQVTDSIREAILDMRLLPGDQLIERELVEWSGVSRATVREAIRELVAENLVQSIPQKGAVVASPSLREAVEIYQIRANLEGMAGRQCAEQATAQEVRNIRRAFETFRKAVESDRKLPMLQLKTRIYDAIFEGSHNETVKDVLSRLQARVTVLRAISMAQPGRLALTVVEVARVVEAIEAGDSMEAELACIAHVESAAEVAIQALRESLKAGAIEE